MTKSGRGRRWSRHRLQRAHDLKLAGGFAREIEHAFEMAGAELAKGEFQQHAGLAETGRCFEEHEWLALEEGAEFDLSRFLSRPGRGEGRTKLQPLEPLTRAQAQSEEFSEAFELG